MLEKLWQITCLQSWVCDHAWPSDEHRRRPSKTCGCWGVAGNQLGYPSWMTCPRQIHRNSKIKLVVIAHTVTQWGTFIPCKFDQCSEFTLQSCREVITTEPQLMWTSISQCAIFVVTKDTHTHPLSLDWESRMWKSYCCDCKKTHATYMTPPEKSQDENETPENHGGLEDDFFLSRGVIFRLTIFRFSRKYSKNGMMISKKL